MFLVVLLRLSSSLSRVFCSIGSILRLGESLVFLVAL